MTDSKKMDTKTMIIAAVVVAVVAVGGFYLYSQNQKETVSISVGEREFSATFGN